MANPSSSVTWQRSLVVIGSVILAVMVIACLYLAQAVLVPVALATLLSFMLSPLVNRIQRLGLGRIPSVLLVVLLAGFLLGGIGWGVSLQVTALLRDLPNHTATIQKKIADLRGNGKDSILGNLQNMFGELTKEVGDNLAPSAETDADAPERVVIAQPGESSWLTKLPATLRPLLEPLAGTFLTLILVIFMLIKREDLRNRLISLVGHGRLTHTTKALDDAGQRISRYLVMQFVINAGFGLALGIGLMAIGLKYAFLWGFLAGALRYLPYIGTWLAALPPIALSLTEEGWVDPLLVLGLFLTLELVTANVLEPLLFGHSTGLSAVALLVSAAFWTWLWGPVGLVLSNPLTVCLVVLGKYVPALKFFDTLMGDEPPLDSDVSYYQRLLAMDQDEATEIVAAYVKANPIEQVYDELLLPALIYAKRDLERDDLTEAEGTFVLRATTEIVEDLGERERLPSADILVPPGPSENGPKASSQVKVPIVGYAVSGTAEELALRMFAQLLDPEKCVLEVVASEMLFSDLVALVALKNAALICIASIPPGGLARTRYVCKRLQKELPEVKIIVGRWGLKGKLVENRELLLEAGAVQVGTTLLETRQHVNEWLPVLSQAQAVGETIKQAKVGISNPG